MHFSRRSIIIVLAVFVALLERSFLPVFFETPFPILTFNTLLLLIALRLEDEALLFSFVAGLFLDMLSYQSLGITSLILILMTLLVCAFKKRVSDWVPVYYLVGLSSLILLGFKFWGVTYVSPMFFVRNVLGFSIFVYLIRSLHVR